MSRTNPDGDGRLPSPINYYFTYKGDKGHFSRWDKVAEQDIIHEKLELIVVDTRYGITGWNDAAQGKLYSNLIRDSRSESLTVRVGKTIVATGIYQDVKPQIKSAGGKYSVNIFCLVKINGQWLPSNIILAASVLSNWSDYVKEQGIKAIYAQQLTISKGEKKKKGQIEWYALKFEAVTAAQELSDQADSFDIKSLSPYLNQYKSNSAASSASDSYQEYDEGPDYEDPEPVAESGEDKVNKITDLIRGHRIRLDLTFGEINVISKRLFNDAEKIVAKLNLTQLQKLEEHLNGMGKTLGEKEDYSDEIPF